VIVAGRIFKDRDRVLFTPYLERRLSRRFNVGDGAESALRLPDEAPVRYAWSMPAIVIWVARESDGVSFALDREGRERLGKTGTKAWPRLFLGWDTKEDYESIHGDITDQIVMLLTGMTLTKLKEFGGVVFRDRTAGREKILSGPSSVFSWPVKAVAKRSPSHPKTA